MIAVCSAGIVIGVASAAAFSDFHELVWLCAGILIATCAFRWPHVVMIVPLLCAGILLGLWRGSIDQQKLAPYHKLIGNTLSVSGVVTEDPDVGKEGEVVLRVQVVSVNDHALTGTIWVNARFEGDVQRSDLVTIEGKLSEGFGTFAASMYRATIKKVQRPQPGDVALQVRDTFADAVRTGVPDPEASLGIGFLVGQRRSLPADLDEALQIAGLMHIVVASGYNLTILVRLARRIFMKVSRFASAFTSGGMILAFLAVTGASPSMSRAGLVAGLSLLAWYYGRRFHPLVLLPFAAAVTVFINPSFAWNDLGWQLSFAAFGGVMIVAPLMQRYFFGEEKPGIIRQILGETVAAQLCTMPILIAAFGTFSNVAILANMLVVPLVPLAMLFTFIVGVTAIAVPMITPIISWPTTQLLHYMTATAQCLAGLPWAESTVQFSSLLVLLCYGGLAVACMYMWRKTGYALREANLVE